MTQIAKNIYSVEGLETPIPGVNIIPYIVQEDSNGRDLTLIDIGFISEIPKFERYIDNFGLKL